MKCSRFSLACKIEISHSVFRTPRAAQALSEFRIQVKVKESDMENCLTLCYSKYSSNCRSAYLVAKELGLHPELKYKKILFEIFTQSTFHLEMISISDILTCIVKTT